MSDPLSPQALAASFQGLMHAYGKQGPASEPHFCQLLKAHFGSDLDGLTILAQEFEPSDHANVHLGLEAWLAATGRSYVAHGISGGRMMNNLSMGVLASASPQPHDPLAPGPVEYLGRPLGDGTVLSCIQRVLFTVVEGDKRSAVLFRGVSEMGYPRKLHIEVMGQTHEAVESIFQEIRWQTRTRNIYRGRTLTMSVDRHDGLQINFHQLPTLERSGLILPDSLLERLERQTQGFAKHRDFLLRSGRHMRRGILLHGPPGTGKTLTAMYLASRMADRTTLLLTGRSIGLIGASCSMARMLAPSLVILEDVDLVAEERTKQNSCDNSLLFELLNEMDGLATDVDVIFLLTTNRPEILEPALASRPGRIDMAVEIGLPDDDARRRLLALYRQGLDCEAIDWDALVRRTQGASGAFIRELLRRSALIAADDPAAGTVVTQGHVDEALHELLVWGGAVTRRLLGVEEAT